jgi:hypothetical protein
MRPGRALTRRLDFWDTERSRLALTRRRIVDAFYVQEQRLPRIQLDDELFIHDRGNLFARRNTRHFALELIFVSD